MPRPQARRPGEGPSAEFLGVSGTLATTAGLFVVGAFAAVLPAGAASWRGARLGLAGAGSFLLTLGLCQFDLRAARRLPLMLGLATAVRVMLLPALTLCAARAVPGSPSGALQLAAAAPALFGPVAAALAPHAYPALMAQLCVAALVAAPVTAAAAWALCTALGRAVPALGPAVPSGAPPIALSLLLSSSLPALAALALYRTLPRRIGLPVAFVALPAAWLVSAPLLAVAARAAFFEASVRAVATSFAIFAAVAAAAALCATLLANALGLDKRAKRSLLLFLCMQSAAFSTAVAPSGYSTAPPLAAAGVGFMLACFLNYRWSKVIIRSRKYAE